MADDLAELDAGAFTGGSRRRPWGPSRGRPRACLGAHRLAGQQRHQGGVGAGVAGVVASVGARPLDIDRAHALHRPAEQLGNARWAGVGLLRGGVEGHAAGRTSATAQAGPMLACDWNGHWYSAANTWVPPLAMASSTAVCLGDHLALAGAPGGCGRRGPGPRRTAAWRRTTSPSAVRRPGSRPTPSRPPRRRSRPCAPPSRRECPDRGLVDRHHLGPRHRRATARPCSMPGRRTSAEYCYCRTPWAGCRAAWARSPPPCSPWSPWAWPCPWR